MEMGKGRGRARGKGKGQESGECMLARAGMATPSAANFGH